MSLERGGGRDEGKGEGEGKGENKRVRQISQIMGYEGERQTMVSSLPVLIVYLFQLVFLQT